MVTGSGTLGRFSWIELSGDQWDVPMVVRRLTPHVVGLVAINTSWDSGLLIPKPSEDWPGWRQVGGLAVSRRIDLALASNWPASECVSGRWDEWYFFRDVDAALQLAAFCNYGGVSLEDAPELAYPGGLDLQAQLNRYQPELVIGHGKFVFAIAREPSLFECFGI